MKKLSQITRLVLASLVLASAAISLDAKFPPPPMPRMMPVQPEMGPPALAPRRVPPAPPLQTTQSEQTMVTQPRPMVPPPSLSTPEFKRFEQPGQLAPTPRPGAQPKTQPEGSYAPAPTLQTPGYAPRTQPRQQVATYAPTPTTYQALPKPSLKDPKSFSFLQKIFSPIQYRQAKKDYATYNHYKNLEKLEQAKTGAQTLLNQANKTSDQQQISIAKSSAERKIRHSEEMAAAQKTGDQYIISEVTRRHENENKAAISAVNRDIAIGTRTPAETVPYTGPRADLQGKQVPLGVPQEHLQDEYAQKRKEWDASAAAKPAQPTPAAAPQLAPPPSLPTFLPQQPSSLPQ
ncbi:hypothetical protein K2W90_03150 [Candidatus Babeliales bacterium]|nr:hypothetical protein [Candidatus Babeliales bacterium]